MFKTSSQIADDVLTKIAANRLMKEMAKGHLNDAEMRRIADNAATIFPGNEKLIRDLGAGSSSNVSEVYHPAFGRVVRKATVGKYDTSAPIKNNANNKIYEDLMNMQHREGRDMGFARVRDVTPEGLIFQDMAPGKSMLDAKYPNAEKEYAKLVREISEDQRMGFVPKKKKVKRARSIAAYARHNLEGQKMTNIQKKAIKELKKVHPDMFDYARSPNVFVNEGQYKFIDPAASRDAFRQADKDISYFGDQHVQFKERNMRGPVALGPKGPGGSPIKTEFTPPRNFKFQKKYLPHYLGAGAALGLAGYGGYRYLNRGAHA